MSKELFSSPREEALDIAYQTRKTILGGKSDPVAVLRACLVIANDQVETESPVQVQKASAIGALLCMIAERGEITTSELLRKVRSEGIFDEGDLVTILLSLAKCHIIEFQRKHTRHLTLSSSRRSFN